MWSVCTTSDVWTLFFLKLIPAEHGVYLEWSTIESWHFLVQTPPTPNSHPHTWKFKLLLSTLPNPHERRSVSFLSRQS